LNFEEWRLLPLFVKNEWENVSFKKFEKSKNSMILHEKMLQINIQEFIQ
jgi:hypothetical protein